MTTIESCKYPSLLLVYKWKQIQNNGKIMWDNCIKNKLHLQEMKMYIIKR